MFTADALSATSGVPLYLPALKERTIVGKCTKDHLKHDRDIIFFHCETCSIASLNLPLDGVYSQPDEEEKRKILLGSKGQKMQIHSNKKRYLKAL
jgi:hypothetical protein